MRRMKLMIPGPVELSPEVLLAMARPMMGHRTPDFEAILEECWSGLKEIFQTKNDMLLITGSGTAGMDAAIASTIKEGDEYVCITGGKFGERFVEMVKAYGGVPREVKVEWGRAVDPAEVDKALSQSKAKAVTLTHNETSTGVLHDAEAVGKVAKKHGALFIMDAITSIGGDYVKADEWGVDICIAGSQKCLVSPPGLAMVSVSPKAWEVIGKNKTRNYYLNLASYKKSMEKKTTPFTPSVTLIYGLQAALRAIKEEGLENRIKRHRLMARATREAVKAMGLELYADEGHASNTVTSIKIPQGLTDEDVRGKMKKEHGILLAGGQDQIKGKIFRIGHMGNVEYLDLMSVLSALELTLKKAGRDIELGSGLGAAQRVFLQG
ncbi:MAG: alanine--glyoxylate aminotransferase family protein [Euryarchaeota archaeon]|nr:alanine--glyoxylate aminotransferase family protein [Euryarchaeota archaeon]